jgi:8-oxo-dGTP pyrophosphatase MutT (NUDIX family)
MMAPRHLSAGILLLHPAGRLLLAHATGARHWDIPKGLVDAGETPRDAALREAGEECGLSFAADDLHELGRFAYRPDKDLHLFATLGTDVDPTCCRCTSTFTDRFGRVVPEADAFEWTPFERIPERCAKNMAALLTQRLSLPDLLSGLLAKLPRA